MAAGRQSRAAEEKSDRLPAAGSRFRLHALLAKRSYWPRTNYSWHSPIRPVFRDRRDLSLNRSSNMSLLVYLRVGERSRFLLHSRLTHHLFVTLNPPPYPRPRHSAGQGRAGQFANIIIPASACRYKSTFFALVAPVAPVYIGTCINHSIRSSKSDDRQVHVHPSFP